MGTMLPLCGPSDRARAATPGEEVDAVPWEMGVRSGRADTPTFAAPTPLPPVWRNRRACVPRDLHIAARVNALGVVVEATGPFLDKADAQTCVENDYGGQGYPVSFTLAMHSP